MKPIIFMLIFAILLSEIILSFPISDSVICTNSCILAESVNLNQLIVNDRIRFYGLQDDSLIKEINNTVITINIYDLLVNQNVIDTSNNAVLYSAQKNDDEVNITLHANQEIKITSTITPAGTGSGGTQTGSEIKTTFNNNIYNCKDVIKINISVIKNGLLSNDTKLNIKVLNNQSSVYSKTIKTTKKGLFYVQIPSNYDKGLYNISFETLNKDVSSTKQIRIVCEKPIKYKNYWIWIILAVIILIIIGLLKKRRKKE